MLFFQFFCLPVLFVICCSSSSSFSTRTRSHGRRRSRHAPLQANALLTSQANALPTSQANALPTDQRQSTPWFDYFTKAYRSSNSHTLFELLNHASSDRSLQTEAVTFALSSVPSNVYATSLLLTMESCKLILSDFTRGAKVFLSNAVRLSQWMVVAVISKYYLPINYRKFRIPYRDFVESAKECQFHMLQQLLFIDQYFPNQDRVFRIQGNSVTNPTSLSMIYRQKTLNQLSLTPRDVRLFSNPPPAQAVTLQLASTVESIVQDDDSVSIPETEFHFQVLHSEDELFTFDRETPLTMDTWFRLIQLAWKLNLPDSLGNLIRSVTNPFWKRHLLLNFPLLLGSPYDIQSIAEISVADPEFFFGDLSNLVHLIEQCCQHSHWQALILFNSFLSSLQRYRNIPITISLKAFEQCIAANQHQSLDQLLSIYKPVDDDIWWQCQFSTAVKSNYAFILRIMLKHNVLKNYIVQRLWLHAMMTACRLKSYEMAYILWSFAVKYIVPVVHYSHMIRSVSSIVNDPEFFTFQTVAYWNVVVLLASHLSQWNINHSFSRLP